MGILAQIAVVILVAVAVVALIWSIRGVLVTPVRMKNGDRLLTVIRCGGSMPELQHTVEGLLWLCGNGTIDTQVVIIDAGMDDETADIAQRLTKKSSVVTVCTPDGLTHVAMEGSWSRQEST